MSCEYCQERYSDMFSAQQKAEVMEIELDALHTNLLAAMGRHVDVLNLKFVAEMQCAIEECRRELERYYTFREQR